ncbi:MAG: cobalamin-dependent protein [Dehalococcoidia bacterium]
MRPNVKTRVLLVKHWMECHDRGVKSVIAILRDAGFEVVYVVYMQPEEVVAAAVEEDVDVIGMSFSTGAYDVHVPKVMKSLRAKGMGDVMVLVGGLIPDEDIYWLKKQGIRDVFGAGSDLNQLITLVGTAPRR